MFHLKDIRRRNVSSSPYLSSRALDPSSTAPNYDPINEHDSPAHIRNPTNGNIATSHKESEVEDVLAPGDIVGKGSLLKGDVVSLLPTFNDEDEDEQFQVIKELGKGSYAVVYLVHQVPRGASGPCSASSRAASNTDSSEDGQILGRMDSEEPLAQPIHHLTKTYGRKFAIKCLSKANLNKEELDVQMAEVTIHQSLPVHPNIVALHKTLQTSSYLLLVLEYVPGEDLFYFLQQARDHYPTFSPESLSQELHLQQQTPPTPSLLSSSHPSHLLSRSRLRLIASMFGQMCDAVATCHAAGVFHRDIKPENFIVTDGRYLDEGTDWKNGRNNKGRVVVKLTDFGLSTREEECSDMDCGSAPYMSYECRNNVAPTYSPREADVWSLGIVLFNMLYHINPWTDTEHGVCPSFTAFRRDPVGFFTRVFTGMTPDVAAVLAWRVFDIGDEQARVNGRVKEKMTAAELGAWVRSNLVDLLAMDETLNSGGSVSGMNGGTSTARVVNGGHRLSLQMRISHRPVSRAPSPFGRLFGSCGGVGGLGGGAVPSPRLSSLALSRAPSLAPALEKEECETEVEVEVERDPTPQIREEMEPEERGEQEQFQQQEDESEQVDATPSRTSTTTKRRRRGLRKKSKGVAPNAAATKNLQQDQQQQQDETLKTLADASQSLVREISNVSKTPPVHQLHLQQHQPSSLTSVASPNHVNGDHNQLSFSSTPSSSGSGTSGISEDTIGSRKTVLTTATDPPLPSMMSVVTKEETKATHATYITNTSSSISPSLKSSNDSTRTASNGSSLRTATTKSTMGPGGSRTKARPHKNYEPVSMYAVPSALLSKPMGGGGGAGGRTPSQLSSSSGSRSVASGTPSQPQQQLEQQPLEQQPKAIVKKSSKWTLKWKNNNSGSGGGNNTASTSILATPSTPLSLPPTQTTPTPTIVTAATPSASDSSSTQGHTRSAQRPRFISSIGLPGHVSPFPTFPANSSASAARLTQGPARTRFMPPIGLPGHVSTFPTASFSGSAAEIAPKTQPTVMSPTASNVTNLIMGLNPAQQQFHLNESSGSLGASGIGGGCAASTTKRGRRGKGASGSMAILSGAVVGGVESSSYQPKSPSRSPGPAAPSFSSGFGSSASSSSVSLVSGLDLGQGQDPGRDWRDKRPSDRMGMESRGMGHGGSVGGSGLSGGSRGVGVRSPGGATGFGAGGGRHGSGAAAWGPLASSVNVFGTSGHWRGSNAMGTSMSAMSSSMGNSSGSGGASLHGSVSASGTASPGASTIAFTRFSNSSVSTMATTISTGSGTANWRNGSRAGAVAMTSSDANLSKNGNNMTGFQTLNELSRGQQPNPDFVSAPVKKARTRNKKGNKSDDTGSTSSGPTVTDATPKVAIDASSSSKDLNPNTVTNKLDTIIERPLDAANTPTGGDALSSRKEASTSTTDLVAGNAVAANGSLNDEGAAGGRVKKVNKSQINTLAKMLSALRR